MNAPVIITEIDEQGIAVNESSEMPTTLSGAEAWSLFFEKPFSLERLIPHMEALSQSIDEEMPGFEGSPMIMVAKHATGEQMALAARLFSMAVSRKSMSYFTRGSLAKMALSFGNEAGALDAALQDPSLSSAHRDSSGVTLFIEAMLQGNTALMDQLSIKRKGISLVDPFMIDSRGNTALINYIRMADVIRVDVLDAFARAMVQSKTLQDDDSLACRTLYSHTNQFGKTAGHLLADRLNQRLKGNTEEDILRAFQWLSQRVDINFPDHKDRTAFMDICRVGNVSMATELERLGGDIAWISGKGITALSTAAYYDKPEIVHLLFNLDAEKVLASINAMTEERMGDSLSIPLLAARQGSWEALYAYLSHCRIGVDTASDARNNTTPLMYAVKSCEDKAVELLIGSACKIGAVDSDGMSAMHYAAQDFDNRGGASSNIFYLLLNAGASMDIPDANGKTPLDIILNNGKFQSSSDFFYRVNISQLASWCFDGDLSIAKKYMDSSQYGVMACSTVINRQHPIAANASTWAVEHKKGINENKTKDIKQGIYTFNMMAWGTGALVYGLNLAVEKNEHEKLNELISLLPADWHFPAITLTAMATVLLQATNACTDFTEVKKIGAAAKHMTSHLDTFFIKPITAAFKDASPEDKGPLGRSLKICGQLKAYYQRVCSACSAFIQVMSRNTDEPKTATDIMGQLDDKLIANIAKLSRHEFSKIHAEARHKVRDALNNQGR